MERLYKQNPASREYCGVYTGSGRDETGRGVHAWHRGQSCFLAWGRVVVFNKRRYDGSIHAEAVDRFVRRA